MNAARPWPVRLRAVSLISLAVIAVVFTSCGGCGTTSVVTPSTPTPHGSKASISVCAVDPLRAKDFPEDACGTGTYAALQASAQIDIHAVDQSGNPLANQKLSVTIRGPNAGSGSVTTDSSGKATYSYAGTKLGSDTVTVAPSSGGTSAATPSSVVVEWIRNQAMTRPIIWVHGIHEDATNFAHEIHGTYIPPVDEAKDASAQTWTSLLDALTTTYTPSAIQVFCYVDDIAWTHATSGCPSDESPPTPACATSANPGGTPCESEDSVFNNAMELAQVVTYMYAEYNHPVTLMAYSMGGAIVRTLVDGCQAPGPTPNTYVPECASAVPDIDHVFLMNAAQDGSWLLTTKQIATFTEEGVPTSTIDTLLPALPLLQTAINTFAKDEAGLDLTQKGIQDLTPGSSNITAQNSTAPLVGPPGPDFYTFYGNIQLGIAIQVFDTQFTPLTLLPIGDLIMLPQADTPTTVPAWGGSTLCGGCTKAPNSEYSQSAAGSPSPNGTYHEWALTENADITMSGLGSVLSAPSNAVAAIQAAINSPVQHLNISQPASQDPGSSLQVKDITGLMAGATTTESNEIYLILVQADGLE